MCVPSRQPARRAESSDGITFTTAFEQARFTCFDQYKNKRYENEGARIDYTIIDQDLLPSVRLDTEGATGLVAHPDCINPLCETCALAAVTSNGRWKPAPYDGTGIVEGRQEVGCDG
jgi:hypothetical protein